MDYARTQKDIQWAVAQHLSPLTLTLLNPSKLATLTTKQLVSQPKPLFIYLCDKLWPANTANRCHVLMAHAALEGNFENVEQCRAWILADGETPNYYWVMARAAYGGHLDLVEQCRAWMLEDGETPKYNWTMASAAEGNHPEIVKQCRKWILAAGKIPNYDRVMAWATERGHENLLAQLEVWQQE